ncbi:hypothetical protein M3Y95_00483400 [Aphelenchoides besseyi]|nr:hypothetical protein M3Y95_00483400 [Aphelenchoides besseyi]
MSLSATAIIFLAFFVRNTQSIEQYAGIGKISGQTPCCIDRLTTLTCKRLKQKNSANFLYNCLTNADFVFVQCCRTCFETEKDDSYSLDYDKVVDNLLLTPNQDISGCYNRRSDSWCADFVMRRSIWSEPEYKKINCANTPIAFRECRYACGYCRRSEDDVEVAVYDYNVAISPIRCHNPAYGLALHKVDAGKVFQKLEHRFSRLLRAQHSASGVEFYNNAQA